MPIFLAVLTKSPSNETLLKLLSFVFPETAPISLFSPTTSSSGTESNFPFFKTVSTPNFPF